MVWIAKWYRPSPIHFFFNLWPKTRALLQRFKHPDSLRFCTNFQHKTCQALNHDSKYIKTHSNSQKWERILTFPNPDLSFLSYSNLKFSQLRQNKWKVKACTGSGAWVEHFLFTNLELMMPILRVRSSPKYLFSWSSIWQWGSFQCKVMVGIASLRCGDAVPISTLPWDTLNWAAELQL